MYFLYLIKNIKSATLDTYERPVLHNTIDQAQRSCVSNQLQTQQGQATKSCWVMAEQSWTGPGPVSPPSPD